MLGVALDVFVPLTMQPQLQPPGDRLPASGTRWLVLLGRLRPGMSIDRAAVETELLAGRLAADDPRPDVSLRATVLPLWRSPFAAQTFLLPIVGVMAITGLLVLVIVCTNLANLALARGIARRAEVAARLAVGAGRARIVRLLLVENVLLALPAAVIGLLLATRLFDLFGDGGSAGATVAPSDFETSIDGLVVGFALVASCAAAAAFSLFPAVRGSRVSLAGVLKGDDLTTPFARTPLRGALVVVQVAAALVLLVAAGLTVRTVEAARDADLGFHPENVISVRIDPATNGYDESRGRVFYQQLAGALEAQPDIDSASVAMFVPLRMIEGRSRRVAADGYQPRPDEDMTLAFNVVGPDY
jgi:hypothetical protein